MASFYKNLAVVVGLTLALLVASNGEETSSYDGSAICDRSTGVSCTSDASCVTTCKQRAGKDYVYGWCSPEDNVVAGGGRRSCFCSVRCDPRSTPPAQAPLEKPAAATPAWRGTMGILN